MKTDGIILDVDGTLWDATPAAADGYNDAITARGMDSPHVTAEQLRGLFGRPIPEIADAVFPDLAPNDRYTLIEECMKYQGKRLLENRRDMLYPGVADTIRTLAARIPLFIVSNCQAGYIETFLGKSGLTPFIRDHICPADTGLVKGPNIRLIMDRYQLKKAVYVGNIDADRVATEEAGAAFCFASYGYGEVQRADYVIDTFADLCTLFLNG
ncbi:MAG: HAD hydrolase-like protein [Lachnospiraceae bacterium]|nr:HAD hydrolase-like protein [Lachnospiraceae bacterium]